MIKHLTSKVDPKLQLKPNSLILAVTPEAKVDRLIGRILWSKKVICFMDFFSVCRHHKFETTEFTIRIPISSFIDRRLRLC